MPKRISTLKSVKMETFTYSKTYGLFTTAANRKIIKDLETRGAKVFQFPPCEIESIKNAEVITFIQNSLAEFDWIIFADVFAVDYFLEILETCKIDFFELDEKRIVAFGEAVSDRLRFSQIHADVIPNSIETDDIFSAILDYLQVDQIAQANFLLPKFVGFETDLKDKLREAGANLAELEIYQIESNKEFAKLKALLTGGAIDEFIFNAPEDVFFLRRYFSLEKLSEILLDIQVSARNEITRQTLRENNLRILKRG